MQSQPPKRLTIVYDCATGDTERMMQAQAQAAGAGPGFIVDLRRGADEGGVAQLTAADGYLVATP